MDVLGQNSNQLLEDLRKLNQLKNFPYQFDSEVDKNKKYQIVMNAGKLKRAQKNR